MLRHALILALITSFSAASAVAESTDTTVTTEAPATEQPDVSPAALTKPSHVKDFRLTDQSGRSHALYRNAESKAVVLYIHGVGCPIVRQSVPALERLKEEFGPKGVSFLMLNANPQDERGDIAEEAAEFGITIPILQDTAQTVAAGLGCDRTAEVLVIDPAQEWKIVYRGAVDDRFDYGSEKAEPEHQWLRDALQAHLDGSEIAHATTKVKGCRITYAFPEQISYSRDVAPIIAGKCVTCHTDGGVGPFAFSNHRKVRGWAKMIEEVVLTRRMPPWHADPQVHSFANSAGITPEEEATLISWIRQGAPSDEGEEDPLANMAAAPAGAEWALGAPDLVLQLPSVQELPAEGIVDYRYLYVETGLTEDKWLRAFEVLPTNKAVVHHALVFIVYPKHYRHIQPEDRSGLGGYFAAHLPGSPPREHPGNSAQFVPAGSTLVFQMHYNTTGKPEQDQTRMGLYFYDGVPENVMWIRAASETDFTIPPNAMDHPVMADYDFDENATIWGLSPHMHYRGGRASFAAEFPDGSRKPLLNVPFYEFDWQPMYWFTEGVPAPPETRIVVDGGFDNSKYNPKNPNPNQFVSFGEQSFEEMFIGYIGYTKPYDAAEFAPIEVTAERFPGLGQMLDEKTLVGTEWRMGRRLNLSFLDDGLVTAGDGYLKGKWQLDGNVINIDSALQDVTLGVVGDELLFNGRPMRRLK